MKDIGEILKGESVELRALEPTFKNAETVFIAVNKNRERLTPYLSWVSETNSPEDSYNFLKSTEEKRKKNMEYVFGIFVGEKYAGSVSMLNIDLIDKKGEIGYWLAKEFTGKGYLSEAVRIMEDEFFSGNNGLNRISIYVNIKNERSNAVAKRNNYVLEGIVRDCAFMNGQFYDYNAYSKLKKEWKTWKDGREA
ncbi:MAG: GNAT family N-acetyltransferase [Rickettsiales bacterium]|nr:GNAT family N-acetyltransferase [Rickettsiales bacterium]